MTSVDRLLDRDGLYITIESPSFRDQALRINDIITLSSECVLVTRGLAENTGYDTYFSSQEPGHYVMDVKTLNDLDQRIKEIEADVLKYFSKA